MEELDFLAELNEPQRAAVVASEGPSLVIAGAGSGKTRVLTYRIAYLLAQGVDPFSILSLTFTNKAAREMRERIESKVGAQARSLWMGTFHSQFAKILREDGHRLGYPSNFTIYDTDDSRSLMRTILKEMGLDDKVYKPAQVLYRISAAKNSLIGPQAYATHPEMIADDAAAQRPQLGEVYARYQQRLFKSGAMDFDDLLFQTHKLFSDHLDVLNKYQGQFKYILVDEFQDTNHCQYLLMRKLSARHQNITVVGDDAQSIYSFRGADIQNILNYEKDYPDLRLFKLEQNYRSTQVIVNAANGVIAQNKAQLPKDVWTQNPEGGLISLLQAQSDNEEGRLVAASIYERKTNFNLPNKSFSILYRTNAQSRAMEEALRRSNIPYRIYGGLSFYQRKEIKDVIAYLRLIANADDEEAFKRVINLPKRGIGDGSVAKLLIFANDHGISLSESIKAAATILSPRISGAVTDFGALIESYRLHLGDWDAHQLASQVASQTGLLRELHNDKTPEGVARYENVQELLNGIKEFVDDPAREDKSLSGFLQDIALLTDQDNASPDDDVVSLMTIHAAKGLEFPFVFITGMEEDLFPSMMMVNSRADLEEERRLFYVALTRAEKKLTLSYATTRYRFGVLKSCEPSRFLTEIDPKFIEQPKRSAATRIPTATQEREAQTTSSYRNVVQNFRNQRRPMEPVKAYTPPKDFVASDTSNLQAGMKVEHPKFGMGTVTLVEARGTDRQAKVNFPSAGEKTLLLSFAKLRILS